MKQDGPQPDRTSVSPSIGQQVDVLGDEFERAWRSGQTPRIEAFLERVPVASRERLLAELLVVEFQLLGEKHETPDLEAYRRRFPGSDRVIDAALAREFEASWQRDTPLRIESVLEQVPPDLRREVFQELVRIEKRYRSERGDPLTDDECRNRFANYFPPNVASAATHSIAETQTSKPSPAEVSTDHTLTYVRVAPSGNLAQPLEQNVAFGPGERISDRYLVEKEIGHGGMGRVYLARDQRLDRPVAIKIMRVERFSITGEVDEAQRESFQREAKIGAGLVHPAIATVHDYGFHGLTAYTVFEYVSGESLRDLIRRKSPMPLEDVRLIVASLALALDYAHARGIVHRDLKPENIRFTEQGQPKILDLGLALRFSETTHWGFSGTPAYAAPEQAAELPSDGRADQYALALIMYEMLTGVRPFQSGDWRQMLELQRTATPAPLRTTLPHLGAEIDEAVLRALRKDPNERYETCEALAAAVGGQFRSDVTRAEVVLHDAEVKIRDDRSWREASFRLLSKTRGFLALQSDRLWIMRGDVLECWPRRSVLGVKAAQRKLALTIAATPKNRSYTVWFGDRAECQEWVNLLTPGVTTEGADGADWVADRPSAVSLESRPNVPYQILGGIEGRGGSRRAALRRLRLEASVRQGDAVIDVRQERLVGFDRTSWRAAGTAVRAIDSAGRAELVHRWYTAEIAKLAKWTMALVLVFFAAHCLGALFFGSMKVDQLGSLAGQAAGSQLRVAVRSAIRDSALFSLLLLHAWPFLAALWLWWTRIPQLARATSLAVLGLALPPIVLLVGTGILCLVRQTLPDGGDTLALLSALDPVNLGLMWFAWLMSRRLRGAEQTLRTAWPASFTIPGTRRLAGGVAMTGSVGYLAAAVLWTCFQCYFIAQPDLKQYGLASVALQSGDLNTAESLLRGVVERSPSASAYSDLAYVQLQRGELAECVEHATRAVALDPSLSLAYVNRAAAYVQLGELAKSIEDCNRALDLDPHCGIAYVNRTSAYLRKGDVTKAAADAARAIELVPNLPQAQENLRVVQRTERRNAATGFVNRALAELEQGRFQECVDAATEAIKIDDSVALAYVNRSAGYLALEQVPLALEDCNRALSLDAQCALAYVNRSTAHILLDNKQAALADLSKALELSPQDANFKRRLKLVESVDDLQPVRLSDKSYLKLQTGQLRESIELASQAMKQAPGFPMAYVVRAAAYLASDLPQPALADCNRAIELDPTYAAAYLYRGIAYTQLGRLALARADAEEAVSRDPGNAVAAQLLAELKEAMKASPLEQTQ